jgi:hypothetical protein
MTKGNNDQLTQGVPGTDVGGHDSAGTDRQTRTERPGQMLGTPNPDAEAVSRRETAQELEDARSEFVRQEVSRANREDLPKLGGDAVDQWKPS